MSDQREALSLSPDAITPHDHQREPPSQQRESPTSGTLPCRSARTKNSVERFAFDKAHGCSSVKKYLNTLIVGMTLFSGTRASCDLNYHVALALDPESGVLDQFTSLSPDFMV